MTKRANEHGIFAVSLCDHIAIQTFRQKSGVQDIAVAKRESTRGGGGVERDTLFALLTTGKRNRSPSSVRGKESDQSRRLVRMWVQPKTKRSC